MDPSDSYLVVERMIQAGEISPSGLESLLDSLEEQQLITRTEHQALLALTDRVDTNKRLPP